MVVRWLLYMAVLILTAMLSILYPDYTSGLLFVGVVLYPAVAWAELMLHRIFLSVFLSDTTEWSKETDRTDKLSFKKTAKQVICPVVLHFWNRSVLPVWQLREDYRIVNQMTGEPLSEQSSSELEPCVHVSQTISFVPEHYGLYTLEKGCFWLSDMFGLLQVRKSLAVTKLFLCTPWDTGGARQKKELQLPETIVSVVTGLTQEASSSSLQGEEQPDLREIREFQPGDRQNRIHQRLTAKLERPMVRVLETEDMPGLLLIPKIRKSTPKENDQCLELLAALAEECLEAHIRAEVWLLEGQSVPIHTEEELEELFYQLLSSPLPVSEEEAFQENREEEIPKQYQMLAWIDETGVQYQIRGGELL